MKKTLSAAVIAAFLAIPATAQNIERKPIPAEDSSAAIILLGMIGMVAASSQLAAFAARDAHNLDIAPLDVDADMGFDVSE